MGSDEGIPRPLREADEARGREAGVPGPTLTARPPQVHGRGAATTASLHIPAFRGGPAELPRGAAGAAGGQADAAARPAPVPVRGLRGDAGEPAAAALGEGLLISDRGANNHALSLLRLRIKWVRPNAHVRTLAESAFPLLPRTFSVTQAAPPSL